MFIRRWQRRWRDEDGDDGNEGGARDESNFDVAFLLFFFSFLFLSFISILKVLQRRRIWCMQKSSRIRSRRDMVSFIFWAMRFLFWLRGKRANLIWRVQRKIFYFSWHDAESRYYTRCNACVCSALLCTVLLQTKFESFAFCSSRTHTHTHRRTQRVCKQTHTHIQSVCVCVLIEALCHARARCLSNDVCRVKK